MSRLILYAIPAFFVTMFIEALYVRTYEWRDTRTSLAMGIANVIISSVTKIGLVALWTVLYRHRLFTLPATAATWVALFFAEDLCYYAFHRASHEIRILWAAHVNHHSSTHYNLSTALRQSWTTPFTMVPFWLPLPLLGFAPWMILTQQAISLLYQYWLHTEALHKLGPLELVFNTPSHHRVHHGSDVDYLDRNHAGILIIWDRLFGTFTPETRKPTYGLTTNLNTFDILTVAFHEFAQIARDVRGARSPREAFLYVFGPPGWSPDGSRQTSKQLQA